MRPVPVNRRAFLKGLTAAALCPLCASGSAWGETAPTHPGGEVHWRYDGMEGPQQWGKLKPDFKACEVGVEQSPLDLKEGIRAELGGLYVEYREASAGIINNGHTIQVNVPAGSRLIVGRKSYGLVQAHFHHPSEHKLNGKSFPLECHFVHKSEAGELAVLGVFIEEGHENATLKQVFANLPKPGPEQPLPDPLRFDALLPDDRAFYRYSGSLTTPPCTEGILWTVFRRPVRASKAQIQAFAALFPLNARPIQPQNRRFLLETL